MAKFDLLTDPETGDLVIGDTGEISFTSTIQESLSQRLELRLNCWKGTWSYNEDFGTPYRQEILFSGRSREEIDAIFSRVIHEEDDVISIKNMVSSRDTGIRTYNIDYVEVITSSGDLQIPITNPNSRNNLYPTPPDTVDDYFKGCDITEEDLELSNKLYKRMNIELGDVSVDYPDSAIATWRNLWADGTPISSKDLQATNNLYELTNYLLVDNTGQPDPTTLTWWNLWD